MGSSKPWAAVPSLKGRTVIAVDLIQLVDEGNLLYNIELQNDDIVVVPPVVNRYVYVLGYVNGPGQFVFTERMNLDCVGAVAMAGGLMDTARAENTYLIRLTDQGITRVQIDLIKMRAGIRPPIYLQSGDTVVVGTNWLVRVMAAITPTYGQGWDKNLKFVGGTTGFQTLGGP
jgi:protein involved in polysaccharide export with SLBB domain